MILKIKKFNQTNREVTEFKKKTILKKKSL